jgi:hypothetical protein
MVIFHSFHCAAAAPDRLTPVGAGARPTPRAALASTGLSAAPDGAGRRATHCSSPDGPPRRPPPPPPMVIFHSFHCAAAAPDPLTPVGAGARPTPRAALASTGLSAAPDGAGRRATLFFFSHPVPLPWSFHSFHCAAAAPDRLTPVGAGARPTPRAALASTGLSAAPDGAGRRATHVFPPHPLPWSYFTHFTVRQPRPTD